MERKKGKTIVGFRSKGKIKCKLGVNKINGKCLKHPRKKK